MNVQEIIVGIILLACLYWIGRRMVHYIKRIRENKSLCEGCGGACASKCGHALQTPSNEKKSDFQENNFGNACRFKK